MAIMQGADSWFWMWTALILVVATSLATWYFTVIGRDRTTLKNRRGEETIERYGTIEEDRAPLPKFLVWTYIGIGVWVIVYVVWTGIEGIGV